MCDLCMNELREITACQTECLMMEIGRVNDLLYHLYLLWYIRSLSMEERWREFSYKECSTVTCKKDGLAWFQVYMTRGRNLTPRTSCTTVCINIYIYTHKHTTFCMKRVWQESIYITVGQILLGYTQCHCTFLHGNNWHDTMTCTVHITLQRKWLLVFSPSQSCIRDTAWVPRQVTAFRNEE